MWKCTVTALTCVVSKCDKADITEVSNNHQTVNLGQYPQSGSVVSAWQQATKKHLALRVDGGGNKRATTIAFPLSHGPEVCLHQLYRPSGAGDLHEMRVSSKQEECMVQCTSLSIQV